MRLVFEISKDELIAALNASEGDTVSVSAKPTPGLSAPKPATVSGSQPTGAAARAAASPAPAAEKGKPGRKSNAQKAAEAAAAQQTAVADDELDLDAELTGADQGENDSVDELDGLLDDDPETDVVDELIGDDNVLKKKLADALQANKKKNNGKAGPATDILRKYAPNLSISEVKKKDVPSLLKDLAK